MKDLVKQFNDLMSHLNGEDNELAKVFKARLAIAVSNNRQLEAKAADDALWRSSLEAGGVDNWCNYSDSLAEGGYTSEGEDDE